MTTDRNESIERLLRHSRAAEPHGADACPDAETLAALADDALTAAARREIEGHVADCHRCQALTAAMVRTEASTRATRGMAPVPWWRGRVVKWLVPVAAGATAVALWVAIPTERTSLPANPPIADAQSAPSPPAAASTDAPASSARDGSAAAVAPASPPASSPPAAAPAEAPALPSRQAAAPAAASPERAADVVQPLREEVGGRADARNEPATVEQERRLIDVARRVESVGVGGGVVGAVTAGGLDVVSPDPQRRWRIGPGSSVQRSVDGGTTWTRQEIAAPAELTAGAAPTPDVCWLAGRDGVVLRTIDGGRQWQRIVFPEAVDLTGVSASSALIAILDTADGRRFRTTDGGLTWTAVR
jgi:hypothetical protein